MSSSLRIYDTKGNEYSPSGGTGQTNDRIKELFYAGVRFAIESGRETTIIAFFRARETRDARSEQFYAKYTIPGTSDPIDDFDDALRQRVESEWGYTIDESSEEMSVFRALTRGDTTVPGSDQDRRILREMVGGGSLVTVGVRDARAAIGLITATDGTYARAAITDSADNGSLSEFDLAVVTGGHAGIEPLGSTTEQWDRTEQSLREQFIDEEIGRIEDAVQTLSRDHGLSSSEIRSRVTRRVPALKKPSGGSSSIGATSGSKSWKQKLLSPAIGKYVAIVAVALLVLIGAGFGAGMLGFGPFADDDTIEGAVLDGPSGEDGVEGVEGATVVLLEETDEDGEEELVRTEDSETGENGAFEFNGLEDENYTLRVENTERQYEELSGVSPGGDHVDIEPLDQRVFGTVVDADDESTIDDATVDLLDEDGGEIDSSDGGEFDFDVEDRNTEYTVRASAEGYGDGSVEATPGEEMTIELAQGQVDLSGTVLDSVESESIEDAIVTATNDAGESESSRLDDDGMYQLSLPRGEYDIEISADGYEPKAETVTLDGDEATENFELDPWASWSGTVREVGDPEFEVNGAEITLSVDDEFRKEATSDPDDGSFSFEGLSPTAEYTVDVERNGYEDKEFTIDFEAGEQLDRDIELIPD